MDLNGAEHKDASKTNPEQLTESQSETESSKSSQLKTLNLGQLSKTQKAEPFQQNIMMGGFPAQPFPMPVNMAFNPMNFMMQMPMMQMPNKLKTPPKNNYPKPYVSLQNYDDIDIIKNTFPACATINDSQFDLKRLNNAEFFILRSTNDDDLHKSIKYGIWTSSYRNNQALHNAFINCRRLRIPIFFFYTVVSSEQYTGVAEMISDIEFSKTFGYWWEESKWSGIFQVKWHFVKDVRYDAFSNLYDYNGKPITQLRDGTRISYDNGMRMLEQFRDQELDTSIFDEFDFMDNREEKLRYERDMRAMMYENMKKFMGVQGTEQKEESTELKKKQGGQSHHRGHHNNSGGYGGYQGHGNYHRRDRGDYNNNYYRPHRNRRRGFKPYHNNNNGNNNGNRGDRGDRGDRGGYQYENNNQGPQRYRPQNQNGGVQGAQNERRNEHQNNRKGGNNNSSNNNNNNANNANDEPNQIIIKKKQKRQRRRRGKRRHNQDADLEDSIYMKKSDAIKQQKKIEEQQKRRQEGGDDQGKNKNNQSSEKNDQEAQPQPETDEEPANTNNNTQAAQNETEQVEEASN